MPATLTVTEQQPQPDYSNKIMPMELHLLRNPYSKTYEVYMQPKDEDDVHVSNLVLVKSPIGSKKEPAFRLRWDMAQQWMDELYALGVRPSQEGSAGELSATTRHLADMRKIAFSLLELNKNVDL